MRWPTRTLAWRRRPARSGHVASFWMKAWPPDHHARRPMGLKPAHRPKPRFEPTVGALDTVVLVLAGVVQRGRDQLLDHIRQRRRPVGGYLARNILNSQGGLEERPRRSDVATLRYVHVDDLAVLVDCPVDVGPDPGDLHVGLVNEPPITGHVPRWPGRADQQRREPLHPPVEGDVVDLDATLSEKLLKIPVRQPVAEIPAHRQQGHLGRETEPAEARRHPQSRSRPASALHRATLTARERSVNATAPIGAISGVLCPHVRWVRVRKP